MRRIFGPKEFNTMRMLHNEYVDNLCSSDVTR